MISWELARAVDPEFVPQWQARLTEKQTVPSDLTARLCDEFDFVHVRTPAQWARLCRSIDLEQGAGSSRPDFSKGCVVGLIARVGQPTTADWPVRLDEARLDNGSGWLRFRLATGLYYPIVVSPYLVVAYVPGLREPRIAQVNRRVFVTDGPATSD
jgi:hypothetical protein